MPRLTFVIGAGRSGTSAITRALEACGADLGLVYEPHAEHIGGKAWIKRMLRIRGFDPLGQQPIPREPLEISASQAESLRAAIEGVDVVKDVKLVFVWPTLVELFPEARFVYVWRDPTAVADSCIRTSFMRAHSSRLAWFRWASRYQAFSAALEAHRPAQTTRVRLSDVMAGDDAALRSAVEASGLSWRPRQVQKVLRPEKFHGG